MIFPDFPTKHQQVNLEDLQVKFGSFECPPSSQQALQSSLLWVRGSLRQDQALVWTCSGFRV